MWIEFLRATFGALTDALRRDPALRHGLREAAQSLVQRLDELDEGDSGGASGPAERAAASAVGPAPEPAAVESPAPTLRDMPLTLGESTVTVAARAGEEPATTPPSYLPDVVAHPKPPRFDLRQAIRRCRLKAEACRWAIERRRHLEGGAEFADVAPRDRAFFDQANAQSCYLWMMSPRAYTLPADSVLDDVAGSYDALAGAIDLMLTVDAADDHADAVEDAMRLLAEAQSAVRAGCTTVDRNLWDADQRDVFYWLRDQTRTRAILIERHMRLEDPAEPANWLRLQERIGELRAAVLGRQSSRDQRRALLSKARYHAKLIAAAVERERDSRLDDWLKIAGAVESLVGDGVPPSDREVRDILLPLIDVLPEIELGPGTQAVLEQIDRYLEQLDREPAQTATRTPSPDRLRARELLRGRGVVLIGGYPRELQRRKIEQAFELAELLWVPVRHHQSLDAEVLPLLRRAEFSVFITMTRFRSHLFGPQLREWCKQYDKVYVELPAGYGVEQIAHQVLVQASEALGSRVGSGDHG